MLQRLSIRGKLFAVVAVPTVVLLLAAIFVLWTSAAAFFESRNNARMVTTVQAADPLLSTISDEYTLSATYLRAISDGNAKRNQAQGDLEDALDALYVAAVGSPTNQSIASEMRRAVEEPTGLPAARAVAAVDTVDGDFPAWPSAEQVDAASGLFNGVIAQISTLAFSAGSGAFGEQAREVVNIITVERDAQQIMLDDARTYAERLPEAFRLTDNAATGYQSAAEEQGTGGSLALQRSIAEVNSGLSALPGLRDTVRAGSVQPGTAEGSYEATIVDLVSLSSDASDAINDRELSASLAAYSTLVDLYSNMYFEQQWVANEIRKGQWVIGDSAAFQQRYFGTDAALQAAQGSMTALQNPPAIPNFGVSYSGTDRTGFEVIRNRLLTDPTDEALIGQRTSNWESQVSEEMEAFDPARADLLESIDSRTATLSRDSLIQLAATALLVILAVVASQLVAQSIARRIENPLRRLTTTATAVRQELPRLVERVAMPGQTVDVTEVQIPVESSDEVGRLAEAFNSVNAATLAIAAEQAALRGSISEMFVNVARRDQVLLNRQLASIDEMERTQDDPDTLTKLFALDHLATRMRRNSESLLVLAGIDTGRRLRRPMPLSDVIRTASSEIELYERVQLELDADPAMLGHSALTAAHLFAELLENATVFSDPGTPVVVHTTARDGAVVVTVTDSGIGMTPEELSEANSRVASTAASEILGAQRLGLFVVGRIARRVGARVHLESEEGKGTVATVVMPPSLFDSSVEPIPSHVSDDAVDEQAHAPSALVMHDQADEVQTPPSAQLPAYEPTMIEEGSILAGRDIASNDTVEVQRRMPDELPTRSAAEPAPMSAEVEQMVASDAADAPEAVQVNLEELTDGQTAQGLPTRRRRGTTAPEAPKDTSSIIALPQRASDEQLTALASAATTGFTPILAADEVSPESAEQRARVFRGFRSMREADQEGVTVAPDAESLGQALRRGAPADADTQPFGTPAADAVPSLAEAADRLQAEAAAEPAAPVVEEEVPSSAFPTLEVEPEPVLEPEPAAVVEVPVEVPVEEPVAQESAPEPAPEPEAPPITRQSPLIQTGFGQSDMPGYEADSAPAEMAVPLLEEDEGPAYDARPWESRAREQAGVEAVSFEDEGAPASEPFRSPLYPSTGRPSAGAIQRPARQPWAEDRDNNAFRQQVAQPRLMDEQAPGVATQGVSRQEPGVVPEQSAPQTQQPAGPAQTPHQGVPTGGAPHAQNPYAMPAAQAPYAPSPQQAPGSAQPMTAFDHGPVTSSPSLDDLIMDGASSGQDRSGFFGRIFGGKAPRAQDAPTEQPQSRPFAPVTGAVPQAPAPEPVAPAPVQPPAAPLGGAAPWAAAAQRPAPEQQATPQQGFQPAIEPQVPAPQGFQPTAEPQAPATPAGGFVPQQFSPAGSSGPGEAMHELSNQAAWPFGGGGEPVAAPIQPQPLQPEPVGQGQWAPQQQDDWGPAEEYRTYGQVAYSPDQLAKPLGWEEAGATALEAAAPETRSEYRPVVQIAPEPAQGGYDAADVFSELSSLVAERPKVEKTKAGLVKRTPVEKVEPLADVPESQATEHAAPRDAEAVRNRFAAFYSGTQRARSDAEGIGDAAPQPLTES